jgi:exopolyphosphatase/guanosine-5'-triphosphate,3'-diphosphate pyrophosphatase
MPPESDNNIRDEDTEVPEGALLAAIDLGSNSFHLIIARVEHEEMRPVQTFSEKVQLGAGLHRGRMDAAAMNRGLQCLARFKQVLDSVAPFRTRVVGTNALRQARNRRDFTLPAQELLGIPVDVIYGREEARLIYLGVAHTLADDQQSRLVVDIGGGSTEFIVGQRFEPLELDSLQLGCVSTTHRHFKAGTITPRRYRNAYVAARLEVAHIRNRYHSGNWMECVGSSGTLHAIEGILQHFGWSDTGITREGLAQLEEILQGFKHIDDIDIEGLSETRRNVILAGVAITAGIFDELGIEFMRTSPGALREGVIYDLLGRLSHEDVRERTVQALMQRYGADPAVADIVEKRARVLYLTTRRAWRLGRKDWDLLRWASRTHEIGMSISHKNYNRHGAYLLRNADLPGFSQDEQETLALLVLGHRRKIVSANMGGRTGSDRMHLLRLICLLRLATLFKYVEELEYLPEFRVEAEDKMLYLQFPNGWLRKHPLSRQELMLEKNMLNKAGLKLVIQ